MFKLFIQLQFQGGVRILDASPTSAKDLQEAVGFKVQSSGDSNSVREKP